MSVRREACLLALVAAAAVAGLAPAATPGPERAAVPRRPDFSGTWVLDTARSEFGSIPGGRWRSRIDHIEHRDPQLRHTLYLDTGVRRDTTRYRYTTDSARVTNRVDRNEIEARVWWEGEALRLESKTRLLVFEMTLKERWTLSADRRTLTMSRRVKYPMGEGEQRLVYAKR